MLKINSRFVFVIISVVLLCGGILLLGSKYCSATNNTWSILISEEGLLIDSNTELPFEYTYINEKEKVYIFSRYQDIKDIISQQPKKEAITPPPSPSSSQ